MINCYCYCTFLKKFIVDEIICCQNFPADHRREKCSFKETCRFLVNCLQIIIHRIRLDYLCEEVIILLKTHIMEEDTSTLMVNLSLSSEDIESKMKPFMTYRIGKLES